MTKDIVKEVDNYIKTFPAATQKKLKQMRAVIKKAAPDAKEIISYRMPAYKINQVLVYFAGYDKHIGFYPTGAGIEKFKSAFTGYKYSKGAVQFPIDQPLPEDLIRRIVQFRIKDDGKNAARKNKNFMDELGMPARRALEHHGIKTLKQLSGFTEKEILKLHGIGPSSIPKLQASLAAAGLGFKK
jgi:uncharacterized protein YdhG (YjbR/CyaY superfamily)